jgi:hypothetical protein
MSMSLALTDCFPPRGKRPSAGTDFDHEASLLCYQDAYYLVVNMKTTRKITIAKLTSAILSTFVPTKVPMLDYRVRIERYPHGIHNVSNNGRIVFHASPQFQKRH